jgi:hypothetical protein
VTLPTSGVVYATLGTQTARGWQYQQAVYTVNPNRASQSLKVSAGPAVAQVGNNGTEVQYVYYFTGGDATQVTHVATSLDNAGVTSRIVKQTTQTVTIGLTATVGLPAQAMNIVLCDPSDPDSPCSVTCDPETDSTCIDPVPGGGGGGGGIVDEQITVYPTEVFAGPPGVPVTFTFGLT